MIFRLKIVGFFQAIGYTNAMYKAYGQTYISDDHLLSVVGAVAAVFNAGGRVFWGKLSDAYGYRYVAHTACDIAHGFISKC